MREFLIFDFRVEGEWVSFVGEFFSVRVVEFRVTFVFEMF